MHPVGSRAVSCGVPWDSPPSSPAFSWGMKALPGDEGSPRAAPCLQSVPGPRVGISTGHAHPWAVLPAVQNKESFTWGNTEVPRTVGHALAKTECFELSAEREKAEKGKQVLLLETATF